MSKKNGIIGALVGIMIIGVVIYTNVGDWPGTGFPIFLLYFRVRY